MGGEPASGRTAELAAAISALEPLLGERAGEPVPLDGGITNRNYRAHFGDGEYVIRFAGKDTAMLGIDREAERLASEAAALLGIAPRLAATLPDGLVTEFVPSTQLPADEMRSEPRAIAQALRRFHDEGPELPTRFHVPALLHEYAAIVEARGGSLPEQYAPTQEAIARIESAVGGTRLRPCHNDLLNGNLLRSDDGRVLIVDWEYAGMNDPYFDLGNLSVNNGFDREDDERLLSAYLDARPGPGERARLALMRLMSDAREAAWGVAQLVLSDLDFDFAGYASKHFDRLAGGLEQPELEGWLDAAAA